MKKVFSDCTLKLFYCFSQKLFIKLYIMYIILDQPTVFTQKGVRLHAHQHMPKTIWVCKNLHVQTNVKKSYRTCQIKYCKCKIKSDI